MCGELLWKHQCSSQSLPSMCSTLCGLKLSRIQQTTETRTWIQPAFCTLYTHTRVRCAFCTFVNTYPGQWAVTHFIHTYKFSRVSLHFLSNAAWSLFVLASALFPRASPLRAESRTAGTDLALGEEMWLGVLADFYSVLRLLQFKEFLLSGLRASVHFELERFVSKCHSPYVKLWHAIVGMVEGS